MPLLVSCLLVFAPCAALHSRTALRGDAVAQYTFEEFAKQYERGYEPASTEWTHREQVFAGRLKALLQKRAQGFHEDGKHSWTAGITEFMDYTEAEYKGLLGYKGRKKQSGGDALYEMPAKRQLFSEPDTHMTVNLAARDASASSLGLFVRNQGGCGSCWAVSAVSVLEATMEKNATLMDLMNRDHRAIKPDVPGKPTLTTLSSQAMVSCALNPKHCGGAGGCEGATAELGYKMVQKMGLPLALHWNYESGGGFTPKCKDGTHGTDNVFSHGRVGIEGFHVLKMNGHKDLMNAVVEHDAPIVISVDGSGWSYYRRGIYTDGHDGPEFTVNHAFIYQDFYK